MPELVRKWNAQDELCRKKVYKRRVVERLQADRDLCTTREMVDMIRRERFAAERFIVSSLRCMSDQDVAMIYLLAGILSLWKNENLPESVTGGTLSRRQRNAKSNV